jgi:hypothetical protein
MVARVPPQISKLRPRLPAPPSLRSLPVVTTHHSLPPVFRPPLCFHALTNPSSRKPFIFTSIQIPRGCGGQEPKAPHGFLCALCASVANPSFSRACGLFVVSLRSFLHSLPWFSIVCGLFSQNAGVWHPPIPLEDTRVGGTSTLVPADCSMPKTSVSHPQRGRGPHIQLSLLQAQGSRSQVYG